jgi:hypothetical protein
MLFTFKRLNNLDPSAIRPSLLQICPTEKEKKKDKKRVQKKQGKEL